MMKCLLLTLKFAMVGIMLFGQLQELMRIVPPSPTSREFDKYINYEVSLYNGVPDISIPLYDIPMGRTTIPIRLDYHASGIKYGQTSGEVGVGWVLQPGYRISRTIYGRADEFYEKPVIADLSSFGGSQPRDEYLTNFISSGQAVDPDLPTPAAYYDGEFDLFTYSTLSDGGTFFIKDRLSKEVKLISKTNLSVNYTLGQDGSLDHFDVKDGNGNKYRFGRSLITEGTVFERNLDPNSGSARSSWLLTDIEDPFGNYARFGYQTFQEYDHLTGESLSVSPGFFGGCAQQSAAITNPPSNQASMAYEVQRISQITSEEVTAIFYRRAGEGMLDSIVVKNNTNQERVRRISFHYSDNGIHTFLVSIHIYGQDNDTPMMYGFEYNGKDNYSNLNGYLAPDYWGYYKMSSVLYPQYPDFLETYVCDISSPISIESHMNKINRNPQINEATLFVLEKVTYPTGGSTAYEFESNKYQGYRDDGAGNMKYAGIRIKQIVSNDEAIGQTLKKAFKYGSNESGLGTVNVDIAVNSFFINYSLGVICTNDGPGQNEVLYGMVREFKSKYTNEIGSSMGSPVHYANVTEYQIKQASTNTDPGTTNGKIEYVFDLSSDVSQSAFTNNSQFDAIEGIRYGSNPNCVGNGLLGFQGGLNPYIVGYEKWDKPILQSKLIYSSDGFGYTLVSKEEYQYVIQNHTSFDGLKVRRFVYGDAYNPFSDYYANGLNSLFDYSNYYVNCANKVLKKKVLTTYSGNDSLKQVTVFYYNSDFQLAKEENENSDGSLTMTHYKYPVDFGTITATDEISRGIQNLKEKHMLNSLIEKVTEVRHLGSTNDRLVNAVFTTYHDTSPLPSSVMVANATGFVTDFNSSYTQEGAVTCDSRYDERVLFDLYDDNGNILQQHKSDDYLHSYIWGYQGRYLIAEVLGASQKDVFHSSFEDVDGNSSVGDCRTGKKSRINGYQKSLSNLTNGLYTVSYWQKAGSSWIYQFDDVQVVNGAYMIDLSGQIDEVRFYPLYAQMTTFTYDPLTGLTSKTDINNVTTYYEYDGFDRLISVKDSDGNIIKGHSYHYRSQSQ